MSKREKLEENKVFIESLNIDMVPLSVAIEILESKEEFNSQVDSLKDKMADLDKMFDNLIKEVND
jgi:hypothetical protein